MVSTTEINKAYKAGGWRERYAIDHGIPKEKTEDNHVCIRFDYDINDPYQDANGAMWDVTQQKWVY